MNNRYAQDDYEAARRFENYKSQDPFPEIQAALLNSADVDDYVAATGMICPFDPKKLKTATYAMDFEGKAYYWNENGEDESKPIEKGDTFKLRKNSIAFINLKAKFRIPNYIALRFNLGITHVHRGILLGTGPLIDPGFEGKILVPLHNLTSNDYELSCDNELIWIEFTKLSNNDLWANKGAGLGRSGQYREFEEDKKNRPAEYYFGKAACGKSIRSSLPEIILKSSEAASRAAESSEKSKNIISSTRNWLTIGGVVGLVTIIISASLGLIQILQLVEDTTFFLRQTSKDFNTLKENKENELKKIELLEKEVISIKEMLRKQSSPSEKKTDKSKLKSSRSNQDVSNSDMKKGIKKHTKPEEKNPQQFESQSKK